MATQGAGALAGTAPGIADMAATDVADTMLATANAFYKIKKTGRDDAKDLLG